VVSTVGSAPFSVAGGVDSDVVTVQRLTLKTSFGLRSETVSRRRMRFFLPSGDSVTWSSRIGARLPQRASGPSSVVVFVPSGSTTSVRPSTFSVETVSAPLGSLTVRRRSPLASTSIV
jgi:hypothetical protein